MTLAQFAAVLALLGKRGRPGTVLSRAIIKKFGASYVPLTSDGEMLVAELIETHEVEEPERQARLNDEQGFIGDMDFLWRRHRLALEVDGRTHDGPLDIAADAARDRRVQALGYEVWRWKYHKLLVDGHGLMRQLARRLDEPRVGIAPIAAIAIQHSVMCGFTNL